EMPTLSATRSKFAKALSSRRAYSRWPASLSARHSSNTRSITCAISCRVMRLSPAVEQPPPVKVEPWVLLAPGAHVAVADDPPGRDLPPAHQLADEPRRGVILCAGVRFPAVVAQGHPDAVVVAVAPALPLGHARMPRALLVRDQAVDPPVPPDEVVVRHTGAGIAA